jgi:hypothetical protein
MTTSLSSTLVVLPCSAAKEVGGSGSAGSGIVEFLPQQLADELRACRSGINPLARTVGPPMPAWRRYTGFLYIVARPALSRLVADPTFDVLILSGGYGVIRADEPISWYDRRLTPADWPNRLLQRCLEAYAQRRQIRRVRALVSRSTPYANVIQRVHWRSAGVDDALLISPAFSGGGAMRAVPTAIGEMVVALSSDELRPGWASSDATPSTWRRLV